MARPALGLIETRSLDAAIEAMNAATAAGEVVIASLENSDSDIVTVRLEGDWNDVQKAAAAGARGAASSGELISMHVIPRSDDEISRVLPYGRFLRKYTPGDSPPKSASKPKRTSAPKKKPAPKKVAPPPMPTEPEEPHVEPRETAPSTKTTQPPQPETASASGRQDLLSEAQLKEMPVVKLRKYARTLDNLPIQGREISHANKQELLDAIDSIR